MSTITAEKAAMRRWAQARLSALSPQALRTSDATLFRRFLALPQVDAAHVILLYCGMATEPDTRRLLPPLFAAGKEVCFPRCLPGRQMEVRLIQSDSSLTRHPYGMLEPGLDCPSIPPEEIDLAVLPGLAFDRSGGRLGRGGGYYDRWLSGYSGFSVALCRDGLLLDRLPRLPHDLGVDLVLTETGLYGPSAVLSGKGGA